jgi:phosphatidylglycerophosphate synthase
MMKLDSGFHAAFLLPLLLLFSQLVGAQQDLTSFPENSRFDPADEDILSCTIPPYQDGSLNYLPVPQGYCPQQEYLLQNMTEQVLDELAVAYAPVLFYHPLERYSMAAVDYTFEDPSAGRIMYENGKFSEVFDDTLNQTALLLSARDRNLGINSNRYYFEHILDSYYVAGAGFDDVGKSRAPIYYNAFQWDDNTWVFTYHFYYTVNGYGNLAMVTSYRGNVSFTRFTAGPYDGHEGDWESMSVMVCPSTIPTQPIAVSYTTQIWNQITDCTAGDCTFYKNSIHPVGFVALNSHATYPTASKEIVFANLESDFFVNLQGVLAVDRTGYLDEEGNTRYFEPDEGNVIRIKEQEEIGVGVSDPSEYWQGFGGTWGGNNILTEHNDTLKCIDSKQSAFINCPTEEDNPVFHLILQVLGLESDGSLLTQAASLLVENLNIVYPNTGKSPRGPSTELSYVQWENPHNAPVWNSIAKNTTAEDYCTTLTDVTDVSKLAPVIKEVPLNQNVNITICFCVTLMIVNVVCYTVDVYRRKPKPPLHFDEKGVLGKPTRRSIAYMWRPAVLYTIFYIATIIGMGVFLSGYTALKNLIDTFLGTDLDEITDVVFVMSIFIIVIDSIVLIIVWIFTHDILLCQVLMAYYDTIGNEVAADHWKKRCWFKRGAWLPTIFLVMYALLLGSLLLAALVAVFGCFNIGLAYGLGKVCADVVGAVDDLCFELNAFGIIRLRCGVEFNKFCDEFASKNSVFTYWGSFISVAGHYYLIASAGAAQLLCTEMQATYNLLPNRSQYLESISDLSERINTGELEGLREEKESKKECAQDEPGDELEGATKVTPIS